MTGQQPDKRKNSRHSRWRRVQAREFNRVHPFYENLKAGKLTTTRFRACGATSYPPGVICPESYNEGLEYIELPNKGNVIVFSETFKGVPLGFSAPSDPCHHRSG